MSFSNSATFLGRGPSVKYTVHLPIPRFLTSIEMCPRLQGALNWTTGETVAVKQIQLANIPKVDLSEIMASRSQL
jgi:hypothetical protein